MLVRRVPGIDDVQVLSNRRVDHPGLDPERLANRAKRVVVCGRRQCQDLRAEPAGVGHFGFCGLGMRRAGRQRRLRLGRTPGLQRHRA